MSEPNDRAFIKVSEEIIRLRNDILVMEKIPLLVSGMTTYQLNQLKNFETNGLHTEEFSGASHLFKLIVNTSELEKEQKRARARLRELEDLAAVYIKGGDIVAAKLTK